MDLKDKIRSGLAAHERIPLAPGSVPAAVLLPLYLKEGTYHVLFTKRTEHLNHHRGEISFPGGVRHPEDRDLLETALRQSLIISHGGLSIFVTRPLALAALLVALLFLAFPLVPAIRDRRAKLVE